ncbi:MAG: hypothetical protein ACRC7F_08720 [Cetobacterium sp.]|uniref:hypothetical protein n=1 Tax=Cetobacterium sp. ZWU0022 TaxID=1340502 RepID=UPI0006456827|nr:hypothetical protein [Cetobacterium sp. ZWU0022]
MKKVILLLFFITSILRADYLITNGEIALFYDGQNNILKNIGNKDENIQDFLSNLQILLIKDYKVYKARNYYTETKFINGKNIFHMKYFFNNQIIESYVIASNENKNNLYIYTNLDKLDWKGSYKLVYKFSPLIKSVVVENKENYYKYGSLNIFKDSNSELLVATERDFENFKVKVLQSNLLKELDERIYLVKDIKSEEQDDFLKLSLVKENPTFPKQTFKELLNGEIRFWKEFENKYKYLRSNVINQIKKFYLISSSNYAQNSLIMNISRVEYIRQLKVLYLNVILNRYEEIPKFNYNKYDYIQNVYSYYYNLKLLNLEGKTIEKKMIDNNIEKIRKDVSEAYRSILNREGEWLDNSILFYEFLSELERLDLADLIYKDSVFIKNEIVEKVRDEILNSSGNIKKYEYIKYLNILEEIDREKNIKYLLTKVDNSLGVLKDNENINRKINLELALLLYKNNFLIESDKIFYSIDYFINFEENYSQLDLDEIFLYLENIHYRGLI